MNLKVSKRVKKNLKDFEILQKIPKILKSSKKIKKNPKDSKRFWKSQKDSIALIIVEAIKLKKPNGTPLLEQLKN